MAFPHLMYTVTSSFLCSVEKCEGGYETKQLSVHEVVGMHHMGHAASLVYETFVVYNILGVAIGEFQVHILPHTLSN